jgi:hypothetical protein
MPDLSPEAAAAATGVGNPAPPDPRSAAVLEFMLFRFFDYTVEPGRSYRYRVRLRLENPNFGVADRFLDDRVLERMQEIENRAKQKEAEGGNARSIRFEWQYPETAWSDPTEVVFVPRDSRVLAVSVKAPRKAAEPSGSMMVVKFDMDTGKEVFEEFTTVKRGQVLNFAGREFPPASQERPPRRNDDDDNGDGPRRPAVTSSIPVDYLTDTLVLDMRGGQRLSLARRGQMTAPGEILLLDAGGNLVVRNELDDLADYQLRTATLTDPRGGQAVLEPRAREDEGGNLGALKTGRDRESRRRRDRAPKRE